MSDERTKNQILEVWNRHATSVRKRLDENGIVINAIDDSRVQAIEVVKIIMHNFHKGDFDINDFKTALDSYNNHNNLWGFANKLGQMYFNQIIKAHEKGLGKFTNLLKDLIQEPKNLRDALSKIETLEKLTETIYNKSKDKRNAPYPGAVGFFLTYFWQIYNHQKWPILYNTLINSFRELGLWEEKISQKDIYEHYYSVYNGIRKTIESETGTKVSYWEIEHVFWNYKPISILPEPKTETSKAAVSTQAPEAEKKVIVEQTVESRVEKEIATPEKTVPKELSFDENFKEYLIPRLSRLLDRETRQEEASPEKHFQTLVAEAYAQLDFQVEILDQSKEKNAFAILRFRSEDIAFIIDCQTDADLFLSETDRRIVKDYIQVNSKHLKREGFEKVAYFLVCNQFEMKHQTFVSYVNWHTNVKKTSLISTEALLHLLAFKLKNKLQLMDLIDRIAAFPDLVDKDNIAHLLGEQ